MTDASQPEPDVLAAEVALGVLEGEERSAAERRRLADPAFAAEVEAWSLRMGRIASDEAQARAAPAGLWPKIERRLGEAGSVVELRLRRSLTAWRTATGAAGAVAAGLAVVLLLRPAPLAPPPPAPTVASIPAPVETASLSTTSKAGTVAFVAVLDPERGELVLTPATIDGLPGKSPELWVIPTGGKPVSLGIAQFGKPVRLKVRDLVGGDAARTLAVSLEPQGGSPTGQPTGPVIASGQLQAL